MSSKDSSPAGVDVDALSPFSNRGGDALERGEGEMVVGCNDDVVGVGRGGVLPIAGFVIGTAASIECRRDVGGGTAAWLFAPGPFIVIVIAGW